MIAQLLLHKILQLFIIMIIGFILVKVKVAKSEDSLLLTKLSLYLFMPSAIINAFNVEITDSVVRGIVLSFAAAFLIHIVLLIVDIILKKSLGATDVERASIIYSNSGNLIIPIVAYVLGDEWVIYSSAFIIVQLIFIWTHGVRLFSSEKPSIKKILLNVNMIVIAIGFVMLFLRLRLPSFVGEITSSLGGMLGPVSMIIAGMLAASVDFRKMLGKKRLYLVLLARLILCPLIVMALLKLVVMSVNIDNVKTILLITYFATITPTAATIMQFSQLHGKDAEYATAINAVTTVGCVATMPALIMLFQAICR